MGSVLILNKGFVKEDNDIIKGKILYQGISEGAKSFNLYLDLYSPEGQTISVEILEGEMPYLLKNFYLRVGYNHINLGLCSSNSIFVKIIAWNFEIICFNMQTEFMFDKYNFLTDTAGELIFNYNGRVVRKTNDGWAFCAYFHTASNWFSPILVSPNRSSVAYTMDGQTCDAPETGISSTGGSFELDGIFWYYCCDFPHSYSGAVDSSGLNRYYLGKQTVDSADNRIALAKELIILCDKGVIE